MGWGKEKCFGCGEEGHYVAQCMKVPPRKCFPVGKLDISHYNIEEVPCVSIADNWVTPQHSAKK